VIRPALLICLVFAAACGRGDAPPPPEPAAARNLVVVTIDTLRADRVGTYGYKAARTAAIDGLARRGALFERAYSVAPITLTAHASLMTGLYPPGHGARHNGIRLDLDVPTLAETLGRAGFATGAFVGAFPLDRRFGLIKGFGTYGDRMPRTAGGAPANERPGQAAVDEALEWLAQNRAGRHFLWVHLFEPHAPYGTPGEGGSIGERYDAEVTEADRQAGRIFEAAGEDTAIVLTADHGEAFGEHGEIGHSIFVYDTTLRVPLILAGPGIPARRVEAPVSLVDLAPTVLQWLGLPAMDVDGIDLMPLIQGAQPQLRELYAESYAPLLDFGWSPLRSLRADGWKYIAAPRPELYHVAQDAAEERDLANAQRGRASAMADRVQRYSPPALAESPGADEDTRARLQALGYVGGGASAEGERPDPKDRRELAAAIARVTSGEIQGAALESALRRILTRDPQNPQAHLRLGYLLQGTNRCPEAVRHFRSAIAARLPGADAHLGLAACEASAKRFAGALAALEEADAREPDNPVVAANLGVVLSDGGDPARAIPHLQRALTLDPDFHEARFNLALAFARAQRMTEAAAEARELLRRLPAGAPQRPEVERLLKEVQ
jgi:choline-sulfatase